VPYRSVVAHFLPSFTCVDLVSLYGTFEGYEVLCRHRNGEGSCQQHCRDGQIDGGFHICCSFVASFASANQSSSHYGFPVSRQRSQQAILAVPCLVKDCTMGVATTGFEPRATALMFTKCFSKTSDSVTWGKDQERGRQMTSSVANSTGTNLNLREPLQSHDWRPYRKGRKGPRKPQGKGEAS